MKKLKILRIFIGILGVFVLAASAWMILSGRYSSQLKQSVSGQPEQDTSFVSQEIEERLDALTLEQKVAQLFFVTPESLTGYGKVTQAGEASKQAFLQYPVGGLVYFSQNLENSSQTRTMLDNMQAFSEELLGVPLFLGVDEEGGTVVRIAGREGFGIENIGDMADIGATGDTEQAYRAGLTIASYVKDLGFNVDFAPVADVFSNPDNTVIGKRSFGSDAELVSEMVIQAIAGFHDGGIAAAIKHFPGHGDTVQDSHSGYASSERTLEQLQKCEFLPFEAGIAAGADFVMVGHITLPNVTVEQVPSSLNAEVVTNFLRLDLGYRGIVITDAMNMGAITQEYDSAEAAVRAIQAGVDMILMPEHFQQAYHGVLAAVEDGIISEDRINQSVVRILEKKQEIQQETFNQKAVG